MKKERKKLPSTRQVVKNLPQNLRTVQTHRNQVIKLVYLGKREFREIKRLVAGGLAPLPTPEKKKGKDPGKISNS